MRILLGLSLVLNVVLGALAYGLHQGAVELHKELVEQNDLADQYAKCKLALGRLEVNNADTTRNTACLSYLITKEAINNPSFEKKDIMPFTKNLVRELYRK